jgi:uncharacterized protein YqeY
MLEQQITNDYIQAMKDKNILKTSTLSFLRAQLKNIVIDLKVKALADADVITVIKKQIKQRQDSIEQYEKGNRPELAEKEKNEMAILKSYLPQEISEEELTKVIKQVIAETGATGIKDMGNVMKTVITQVAGKADNKIVSTLVKQLLSQ